MDHPASTMARNRNGLSTSNETIVSRRTSFSSLKHDVGDSLILSSVHGNVRQKGRKLLEEGPQVNGLRGKCNCLVKGNTCTVSKHSIVASRGELARNNCATRETPAPCIVNKKSKSIVEPSVRRDNFLEEEYSDELLPGDSTGSRDLRRLQRVIRKSLSVPVNLKGLSTGEKGRKTADEGILKKSSAFLTSLAHPECRLRETGGNEVFPRRGKSCTNGYRPETGFSAKYSTLKGYFSTWGSFGSEVEVLRRSPSVQTLPVERKKSVQVKKSVSFSSDTSFEEKRAPLRRPAVHEVKVYHKGVLQDRGFRETANIAKVPPSWETPSEGRSALLRAARDADDSALNEIANRVRKFGLGDMEVNVADSSGRTAISYMAGNGAPAMLELALSFHGVDPNIPDNEGNTPLHFAAQAGQTECLNILLQRCPDIEVDARNASGFTPLMKAALQGRTKCAKILLFAGANPTLRDHGRGLRAEQWARFCGRYVCAEVIERFARHRLLERSTSCRWGSEPELAAKVLQGKVMPMPTMPLSPPSSGLKSKIRRVFRTTSGPDRHFSLVSQLTSAALCASSPALPKSSEVPPVVKSLLRPLSVPQLRVTLVAPQDFFDQAKEKYGTSFSEKMENSVKPSRSKKKSK